VDGLVELYDQTDLGDLYTPSPRGESVRAIVRGARVTRRGPLRGEIEIRTRIQALPTEGRWRGRRRTRGWLDTTIRLSLDAGAAFVRVHVFGENNRTDHRLRLAMNAGVAHSRVVADAAFGPVERVPIAIGIEDAAMERAPATAPLHRYVSLFDGPLGATLFSDGLAEYDATDEGKVLVTLLRAVGELSRNDLPERPGHAGWPTPTPGAQCPGPFEAHFALALHGGQSAATSDLIERLSDDVLLPLVGTTLRSAVVVAGSTAGLELHGEGLAFSACKDAEAGNGIVLRCVNLADRQQAGEWACGFPVGSARRGRLDERSDEDLQIQKDRIRFIAAPREVVTLLVTPVPVTP